MSKKLMFIILPVAALATFGGAFVVAYLSKADPEETSVAEVNMTSERLQTQQNELGLTQTVTSRNPVAAEQSIERMMSEQQLRDLVREMRDRLREYESKLEGLGKREERLQAVQAGLQTDIDELNELRVEAASAVAELKRQQTFLEKTRIRIQESELANLKTTAKTLDAMDSDSAGQLVVNICKNPSTDLDAEPGATGTPYAVKLLHYMTDKKRAKLVAALIELEPNLAAQLTQKLKRIMELN